MEYAAGIDGGGTKTVALLADMHGNIIARSAGGPANPNVVPYDNLLYTFNNLFDELEQQCPDAMQNVSVLFAGISGAGNAAAKYEIEAVLKQLLPKTTRIQIEADTINALYSGTYGDYGIVHISGTGSITYGINARGQHGRVGGWGYLFGDEGSGYEIGRQGIIHALKAQDGRGPDTVLLDKIYDHFREKNPYELVRKIYTAKIPKEKISPVSKLVFEAYRKSDSVATHIIADAADEISMSIRTLYNNMFNQHDSVRAVLCGGIFYETDIIPPLLYEKLTDCSKIELSIPKLNPAGGSLIGAYLMKDQQLDNTVIESLISNESR
ncbi:N-acetylglucosamine kinase [Virgibacillus siamensis]|uniref:N-acetylglucosamine kinase n=1 Tax=Virgibacillus siamensis TaxID=480071 RepID=UPI000985AC6F|nr:BadF/BadG/BcrA/BcrD ATPase family protein [Virgibacillus siamensis]